MPERRPKPKLPRSIIILNIIMIALILLVCALTFSLAYSGLKKDNEDTTSAVSDTTSESLTASGAYPTTEDTTSTKLSVSMTKRTTEPTEPITLPNEPDTSAETSDNISSSEGNAAYYPSYSKEFFADDLFIGDSISTGLYLYGKLDMKNVAAGIGYTPYKAYTDAVELYDGTSATALEYAEQMRPKRIFIMLGSNGMGSSADIEAMKTTYRTLIEKLSAGCPDSEIYCISVSPVTADSSAAASAGITNEMIRDFNDSIKDTCEDMGIKYFDLYSLLCNDSGYFSADYAEVDGLHFLGATYDVMLGYIQSELS